MAIRPVTVSVVIPTRNGAERLPIVLEALSRQTVDRDLFEVVVVDDDSSDRTGDVALESGLARVVRAPSRLGAAQATYLAFTDDDTVPHPRWLELGLARASASASGIVAGRIDVPLGDDPTITALVDLSRGYLDQPAYVADGFAATANLWVRRDVFDRVGVFDGSFSAQGHDRDFGERLRIAGLEIEYADDVVVDHPPRERPRQLAANAYRLGFGVAELRRRSVGDVTARRDPWTQLAYYRPWRSIPRLERLRAAGYRPGLRERLAMRIVQYLFVQLPTVAGSVRGTLSEFSNR
jgi:glycosyltransferase involved in cell wall biosynthesis